MNEDVGRAEEGAVLFVLEGLGAVGEVGVIGPSGAGGVGLEFG